ncbi:hypothetical protein AGMMS49940_01940 [Spirochaetia bacterium]|nr:hypothetical protein AGMMS49940_01940 [Spirochaetia bacterium]
MDTDGQTFLFQAVLAGAYELKFYRQDFIRDYIINDLVTLIVEEEAGTVPLAAPSFGVPVDRGRVAAEPRWPGTPEGTVPGAETVPPAPTTPSVAPPLAASGRGESGQAAPSGGTAPLPGPAASPAILPETPAPQPVSPSAQPTAGASGTVPGTAEPDPLPLFLPDSSPEEYLRKAREEYDAGHIPQALAVLDQFMAQFPLGSDEALWLYGQMYEAAGASRNIRSALDCYRRLIQEYPQSNRYADARRRIAYLERYYITIQ